MQELEKHIAKEKKGIIESHSTSAFERDGWTGVWDYMLKGKASNL